MQRQLQQLVNQYPTMSSKDTGLPDSLYKQKDTTSIAGVYLLALSPVGVPLQLQLPQPPAQMFAIQRFRLNCDILEDSLHVQVDE